jgi:tetratricopeptide (TPR) repeat protein
MEEAKQIFIKAFKGRDKVSYRDQLHIDFWKNVFEKDQGKKIDIIHEILRTDPKSRGWRYGLGQEYYLMNEYKKAVEAFEKAWEMNLEWGGDWKFALFYNLYGLSLHQIGYHEKEHEIYEEGLRIMPDQPDIIFCQAVCALSQSDSIKANDYILNYRTIKEQSGESTYDILHSLGKMYDDAGISDQAEKYYRQSLKLKSDFPSTLRSLAYLLINNEIDVDEGMKLIKNALLIDPENGWYLHTQGWGYYKQGKYDKALEILKQAEDKYGDFDPVINQHINIVTEALLNQKEVNTN